MKLQIKSDLTIDFQVILLIPFLILLGFIFNNSLNFILIILPAFLIIFLMHSDIQTFQEFQSKIDVKRSYSSTRINDSNELVVTLVITNNSDFDSRMIELIDNIPNEFSLIDGTNVFLFNIKAREKISLTYTVKCFEIGIYRFKSIFIKHTDFFGFLIESFEITPPQVKITVTPSFERLDKLPIFSYWMKYFNGYFISKEAGNDNDFRGIREYQYGDRLQRINWKKSSRFQTARSSPIYSNIFNYDKAIDVELVLDLTLESFPMFIDGMRIIGSLTDYFLRNRNKVGMTIAKQLPEHFEPKMGNKQLKVLIDKILLKKPDHLKSDSILLGRLMLLSQNYNKRSIVIVVSTLLNPYIVEYCKGLKNHGFVIIVIQLNSLDKQLIEVGSGKYESFVPLEFPTFFNIIAFDFLVENYIIKNKIVTSSIPILEWRSESPLRSTFNSYRRRI